jgi:DNA-binding IclR family transcriptional regulator
MSRKLGALQQKVIDALGGGSLRGVEIAAQLAPSSPSAVRRAVAVLGQRGAIEQGRDRRWRLPLPSSSPGIEATMRRLRRDMRRAAENVEIKKLKRTIRGLVMENRRLTRLLRESEINPYSSLERMACPPPAMIKRGF